MRRFVAVLLLVMSVFVVAVPAFAQDRPSIPEVLANDTNGRFTTLLAAVEAAGLVDVLSGEGPFTVLAPTNDAIAATLGAVGLSAEDLLADTDTLTAILTYHVIPEQLFFRNIIGGGTFETVQGDSVQLAEGAGGRLQANGLTIIDVDNIASNGIVHVLEDGVLLPGAVAEALAGTRAYFRVGHYSPDAGPVDVYIDGELSDLAGVEFGVTSDWIGVPAGTYEVAVAPAGTSVDDAVLGPVSLTFGAGSRTIISAVGTVANETLQAAVLVSDSSPLAAGESRVTVLHAIDGAPVVDVTVLNDVVIDQLGFPGQLGNNDGYFELDVPAGVTGIRVVSDEDGSLVLDASELVIQDQSFYFIVAGGTPDAPEAFVSVNDASAFSLPGTFAGE